MRLIDVTKFIKENPVFPSHVLVALSKAPTIDAVPVVRCKDCKHRFEDLKPEFAKGSGICMKLYDTGKIEGYLCRVNADDFCSYGERKDGDGND